MEGNLFGEQMCVKILDGHGGVEMKIVQHHALLRALKALPKN